MKTRLKYLAPGLALIGFHALLWALGAPASHVSLLILAVGVTILLNLLFNAYRREEKAHADHIKSLEREQTFYTYARGVFNAQSAVIARLQARLYRRDHRS